ncbi:Lipopolysaccharide transport system ATP-binding protein [Nitrosomonas nitrosa]|uniref:Lipopolysaccharide transport system ATP-binding protein n=1 Tax=Nitrosomonas nitrosa TaxID=52442 RepID=A0A8H8Z2A7_9PROT|nr:ABC transporter ATP-binding protein [Nitrosomonas nitrosa]MCO6434925.1 ABC transporter ATP-binding protein [Nitrosomonas nitrosa]CAE6509467.1 Lipopolysaccharide transport system ATP-binding protein [Nitrosomonas nitrosa]
MFSDTALAVNNLSKCYHIYDKPRDRLIQMLAGGKKHYFREFWALRNITFTISRGETVGIIGRNGSGKSTLLQIIAGTLSPTTGEVNSHGLLAALLELGSGFNPEFTGRENVYLNGSVLGLTQQEIHERIDQIADFADIGEYLDQPVKTYSSGMYIRLAFAVQACIHPQILIVDEALSVGDEKFQRKCYDYIDRLRANGSSILLVTHSTATIEKFCQRAILLHKGELHGLGPAKEIVDQYHALLYSDEKTYLRYLNARSQPICPAPLESDVGAQASSNTAQKEENPGLRAIISHWEALDQAGDYCEAYRTGDKVKIRFHVDILESIQEIQAGILIRTIEGVSAFGTSTLYYDKNYLDAKSGMALQFDFNLNLMLCTGTYFVTLAIAEAISPQDMSYLDRKTDVIILNITETHPLGSGIASLKSTVSVKEISSL